jgi:hypothetical protein
MLRVTLGVVSVSALALGACAEPTNVYESVTTTTAAVHRTRTPSKSGPLGPFNNVEAFAGPQNLSAGATIGLQRTANREWTLRDGTLCRYVDVPYEQPDIRATNVGPITFAGLPGDPHVSVKADGKGYEPVRPEKTFWNENRGGVHVVVTAPGNPAEGLVGFRVEGVTPARIGRVFEPRLDGLEGDRAFRLPHRTPLDVRWTGPATRVHGAFVNVSIYAVANEAASLDCDFASDQGHGSIPADVLNVLPHQAPLFMYTRSRFYRTVTRELPGGKVYEAAVQFVLGFCSDQVGDCGPLVLE